MRNTKQDFLPARQVWERYGVTSMTLHRWTHDAKLQFPAPHYIGRFRYWRVSDLDEWDGKPRQSEQMAAGAVRKQPARTEEPDATVLHLYIVTQPTGSRSYAYRYRASGQTVKYTIGVSSRAAHSRGAPVVSLKEARIVAHALNQMIDRLAVEKRQSRRSAS